jgi:hypothetical protein
MALTQAMTTSFKSELLTGTHVFGADVFKIALYNSTSAMDATTTAYTVTNEVGASGTYAAGGQVLATLALSVSGVQALVDWTSDPSWTTATITARSALIYNSTKSNKSVAVIDFGADKISTAGTFTVVLPAATASNAIVRIE